jgi:PD-(D/E)XK nuclease superfamily
VEQLSKILRQRGENLEILNELWPNVEKQILGQRRELSRQIGADDPVRLPIDLLSPLRRRLDETTHTRALAYLLNPSEMHGFGKAVLEAVLKKLPRGRGARQIINLLGQKRISVEVKPEYRYEIEGSRDRSVARCDVRIELRSRHPAALIILENKIDAPEGKGQLGWYEKVARNWQKTNNARPTMMIYLAREKRHAEDAWSSLTYLELASALRAVWQAHRSAPGVNWLGLYIATITGAILGMDIDRLESTRIEEIKTYLGRP